MANLPGIPLAAATVVAHRDATPAEKHTAQEFESVFLTEMLQPMFEGIGTDGIGEGGEGEEMFRPMLIEQYAHAISKAGGLGLANHVLSELTRMQTAAPSEGDDGAHR
jgi:peptidoglycan hydrolase FlgJ